MSGQQKKSTLTTKKQQFRRQIRAQQLQNYIKNIRLQIQDQQQYLYLKTIIAAFYSHSFFKHDHQVADLKLQKLKELLNFVNLGRNLAVVTLAQLLLNKIVTLQMIEQISCQETQNCQSLNNSSSKNDIMAILKFPCEKQKNEGWLALVRVLLNLNYCTQAMIRYCIKTIARNKSLQSVQFSLQIIYILIADKKMLKIQEIVSLIFTDENSGQYDTNQHKIKDDKLLAENFFDSLMKFSLKSTFFDDKSSVMYYATKLICRCFQSKYLLEKFILPSIPLAKLGYFLGQKFNIRLFWQQTKTLKMTNDILVGLSTWKVYKIQEIVDKMLPLVYQILHEVDVLITDRILKRQGQLGLSRTTQHSTKNQKEQLKFLQQAIYLFEILIQNYFFTHSNIRLTKLLLEKLTLEIKIQKIHKAFILDINELREDDKYFLNGFGGQKLSEEQRRKLWILQQTQKNAKTLQENLSCVLQQIESRKQNNIQPEQQQLAQISRLIVLRLRQSQIRSSTLQQPNYKQYQI